MLIDMTKSAAGSLIETLNMMYYIYLGQPLEALSKNCPEKADSSYEDEDLIPVGPDPSATYTARSSRSVAGGPGGRVSTRFTLNTRASEGANSPYFTPTLTEGQSEYEAGLGLDPTGNNGVESTPTTPSEPKGAQAGRALGLPKKSVSHSSAQTDEEKRATGTTTSALDLNAKQVLETGESDSRVGNKPSSSRASQGSLGSFSHADRKSLLPTRASSARPSTISQVQPEAVVRGFSTSNTGTSNPSDDLEKAEGKESTSTYVTRADSKVQTNPSRGSTAGTQSQPDFKSSAGTQSHPSVTTTAGTQSHPDMKFNRGTQPYPSETSTSSTQNMPETQSKSEGTHDGRASSSKHSQVDGFGKQTPKTSTSLPFPGQPGIDASSHDQMPGSKSVPASRDTLYSQDHDQHPDSVGGGGRNVMGIGEEPDGQLSRTAPQSRQTLSGERPSDFNGAKSSPMLSAPGQSGSGPGPDSKQSGVGLDGKPPISRRCLNRSRAESCKSLNQRQGAESSQGPGQDSGQGMGLDSSQGMGQDSRQGMGQDSRQGMGQDSRQGMGQDSRQGMGQDSRQSMGQDSRQGMGQDSGQGPGQRSGRGLGQSFGQPDYPDGRQSRTDNAEALGPGTQGSLSRTDNNRPSQLVYDGYMNMAENTGTNSIGNDNGGVNNALANPSSYGGNGQTGRSITVIAPDPDNSMALARSSKDGDFGDWADWDKMKLCVYVILIVLLLQIFFLWRHYASLECLKSQKTNVGIFPGEMPLKIGGDLDSQTNDGMMGGGDDGGGYMMPGGGKTPTSLDPSLMNRGAGAGSGDCKCPTLRDSDVNNNYASNNNNNNNYTGCPVPLSGQECGKFNGYFA